MANFQCRDGRDRGITDASIGGYKTEYELAQPHRSLPECCFLEAGIATLSLPADFNWVGPAACERCQKLQSVDLFSTDVVELLGWTFAHCSQLQQLSLPHSLRIIEQEAFLLCVSLQEVSIPPSLLYIARRAFAGCMKLRAFRRQGKSKTWRGTYAHRNVFDKCGQLIQPIWLRFLPPTAEDQWERTSLHQPCKYMPAEPEPTCHFYIVITYYDSLSLLE